MIINNIVSFFLWIASFLIDLLPNADSTVTGYLTSGITQFRDSLVLANYLFPVDQLLYAISLILVIEGILFVWKGARFIAGHFTFGASK